MKKAIIGGAVAAALGMGIVSDPAMAQTVLTQCQAITAPGVYVLGNNLTGAGVCITIGASNVELDLAGFTVSTLRGGVGIGGARAANGSFSGAGLDGTTIKNGTVVADQQGGVIIPDATNSIIEDLTVSFARGAIGIIAQGAILHNTVRSPENAPGGIGIESTGGLVVDNYVSGALGQGGPGTGILAAKNTTLFNNTVVGGGNGIVVTCPAHIQVNATILNRVKNLVQNGQGCVDQVNLAP